MMQKRLAELVREAKEKYIYSDEIAQYLIEHGVVALPCKVGDTVYRLAHNKAGKEWMVVDFWEVVRIEIYFEEIGIVDDSDNYFTLEDIGESVFFSREEAEAKAKEKNND